MRARSPICAGHAPGNWGTRMANHLTLTQLRDKTMARVWQDQKTAKLSAYLAGKVVAEMQSWEA